jgi:hypothetical protein
MALTLKQKVAKVTEFHELALAHAATLTEQLRELQQENTRLHDENWRLGQLARSLTLKGVR